MELHSILLTKQALAKSDAVVIVTPHEKGVDYASVVEHSPLLIGSANATKGLDRDQRMVRVGAPASFAVKRTTERRSSAPA